MACSRKRSTKWAEKGRKHIIFKKKKGISRILSSMREMPNCKLTALPVTYPEGHTMRCQLYRVANLHIPPKG